MEEDPSKKAPGGTQAVIRALRLLKSINRSTSPLSLDDLASSQALTRSTAHRILSALVSEGLVQQDPETRSFLPGPESFGLGGAGSTRRDLRSIARPVLERLSAHTGETATLEIRIDSEMLILDEIQGRSLVGARAEVGTRWPMFATSSGKAVMAALAYPDLDDLLGMDRPQLTAASLTDRRALLQDLQACRERGYATAVGELQEGFSAVSTVVTDADGALLGTISLGGPSSRLPAARLRELGALLVSEAKRM